MRPADMTRAISLCILAFTVGAVLTHAVLAAPPSPPRWSWYPVNTNEASGIKFYFENAPASWATVTVSGRRSGNPFTVSGTVNTASDQGDAGFLPFETGNLDRFELGSIRIVMAGRSGTQEHPKSGTYYRF